MNSAPHDNAPSDPKNSSDAKDSVPAPSKILATIRDWLRRYRETPRDKSKWTEIATVILTLVIAGAALWSAWIFQGQLKEAHRTTELAERQLELTARPWIEVTDVRPRGKIGIMALSFQDVSRVFHNRAKYQAFFNYEVHIHNVGHSPALNVQVFPELYIAPYTHDGSSESLAAEEKRYCDSVTERQSGGTIVLPQEPGTIYEGVGKPIYPESMTYPPDHPGTGFIVPVLIGCVDYQFQARPRHYQTRFVYELFHAHGTLFFVPGEGVSAQNLRLVRVEADDYAN